MPARIAIAPRWVIAAMLLWRGITSEGFAPVTPPTHRSTFRRERSSSAFAVYTAPSRRRAELRMSDDGDEGPGLAAKAFGVFVLLYFAASAFVPLYLATSDLDFDRVGSGAVATRQSAETSAPKNYPSLSPAQIQQKLSKLPVFYVSTGDETGAAMGEKVYLSYREAEAAVAQSPAASPAVRATTLDQVSQLVLGRETKTTAATPAEVRRALERRGAGAPEYALVPSAAALHDARDAPPEPGDVPLFAVDRLAFAGDDGRPRVPLFTERGEGRASYARLRGDGARSSLPAEPTLRATTLREVLEGMEKGTRPAADQLEFYGNADDALQADAMASHSSP